MRLESEHIIASIATAHVKGSSRKDAVAKGRELLREKADWLSEGIDRGPPLPFAGSGSRSTDCRPTVLLGRQRQLRRSPARRRARRSLLLSLQT